MLTKLKIAFTLTAALALSSCEHIRDRYDDCGVWLEFVFDHNMEYTDSFEAQVKTVDVYLFDKSGRFVEARHAATSELDGRRRMFLNDLSFGDYKVLTVGNLTEHFRFADRGGNDFVTGATTTIEQAMSALRHDGTVSGEFSHFYFGPTVEVDYHADLGVYRVPLIRQTNKFDVVLQIVAAGVPEGDVEGTVAPRHTVEIIAPESGAYDWRNNPTDLKQLTYRPYTLTSRLDHIGSGIRRETSAKLNTMRLLENERDGYRITVRDIESGHELYGNDLLSLLALTKPAERPDGTELSRAEYFDRQGDWNIVIVYTEKVIPGPEPGAFVAVKIVVNGWIVWQHGMDPVTI